MTEPLTSIRLNNIRGIRDLTLPTGGLTVLLGENGTGKSTVVEVLEILRKTTERDFVSSLYVEHGAPSLLLRQGTSKMAFGFTLASMKYEVTFGANPDRTAMALINETVERDGIGYVERDRQKSEITLWARRSPDEFAVRFGGWSDQSALNYRLGDAAGQSPIPQLARSASEIVVHVPFATAPLWVDQESGRRSALRTSHPMPESPRLIRGGANLAACFHELKNGFGDWSETISWVRRGLPDVRDVVVKLARDGQGGVLALRYAHLAEPVPAAALSDGTLAWLAHVAVACMERVNRPSLLVFDEPELHLHPRLQSTLTQLYSWTAEVCPVLIATQSDAIVDALDDAAASTILLEATPDGSRALRADRETLEKWLKNYRFGELRALRQESTHYQEPLGH